MQLKINEEAKKKFIDVLRQTGNKPLAAKACGFTLRAFYNHYKSDEAFHDEWDEAVQESNGILEREAWRRALEGTEKPIMYKGQVIGKEREYSDRLLEFLLMGNMPEKYARNKMEITGKGGTPLIPEQTNNIEIARRVAFLLTTATNTTTQGTEEGKQDSVH